MFTSEQSPLPFGSEPPQPTVGSTPTLVRSKVFRLSLVVETACVAVALLLAWFGWYDRRQPLSELPHQTWWEVAGWTVAALVLSAAVAAATLWLPWAPCADFRRFVIRELRPFFDGMSVIQVAVISASAGVGEELLFRWCLQGGLQTIWPGVAGGAAAVLVASLAFGAAHAITPMYFAMATLMGLSLGGIMHVSGSVLPPILAHALYDFFAIRIVQRQQLLSDEAARPESPE